MLVLDASAAAAAAAIHAEVQRASRHHDVPMPELGSGSIEFASPRNLWEPAARELGSPTVWIV
jgi:hypothetical protein